MFIKTTFFIFWLTIKQVEILRINHMTYVHVRIDVWQFQFSFWCKLKRSCCS